jgi:hypothetical protein
VVRAGEDCDRFSATIDATGRTHAVVLCDGGIRYLTSVDRVAWQEHDFVPAIDTIETDPQVTTDGGRVYVAFTRLAPEDGGCGDDGLRDLGVFVQSKPLAGGDWSDPAKLGAQADHLQSFRVADGTLYATVTADDGGAPFFVSSGPGGAVRIPIPKAVATSLRIGDDGRARIAFVTEHAIRYGVVDGERLSATTIAHEDSIFFRAPSLVLGPGGTAGALWTETSDGGGGCASPGPGPLDGQYVATKDAAGWHIKRLTKGDGMAAMTMDADTGVVTVAVGAYVEGGPRVTLFSNEGGTWHRSSVAAAKGLYPAVLRHDPTTGDLVLFGANSDGISVVTRS